MSTAVVIGGGISGLSAAYYLQRLGSNKIKKIILLESSQRLGGWINSSRQSDGAIFECGPRSLRPVGKPGRNTLRLIEELDLEKDILPLTRQDAAAKNRYLYVNKKLCALPSSLSGVVRKQDPFSKALLWQIVGEVFKQRSYLEDETIHSFLSRRIGREFADIAVDAMCRGIFAGDCRNLSMKSCFKDIFDLEKSHGSFVLGMLRAPKIPEEELKVKLVQKARSEKWASYSFVSGMQQLPEGILTAIGNNNTVEIRLNSSVKKLLKSDNGKMNVVTENDEIQAEHVFSSVYSKDLAEMLNSSDKYLKNHLRSIQAVSCAVVNLEYKGHLLPVEGFGHLSPSSENGPVLGIIYDSCSFPAHDSKENSSTTRITVMLGGAWADSLKSDGKWIPNDELLSMAIDAASEQLSISAEPIRNKISLLDDCIPQYYLRHSDVLDRMDAYICENNLPLHLIGASYKGVSVNDCILNSKLAVEKIV